MVVLTAIGAGLLGAGLTACQATAPPVVAESTALPEGVTVELRQTRADVPGRQAAVAVHNASDRPIEVGEVSVADPRFSAPAERTVSRTSTVPAGGTVDIRVQLATVACDEAPEGAEATVTVAYRWGETDAEVTVPITDTVPFVAALHENECLQVEAERSATVAIGAFVPSEAGEPARLDLDITPTDGVGTLRIIGIRETNLLTFPEVVDSVYALDIDQTGEGRDPESVALPLLPARCDAHAVQEDKRGTVFRLQVEVDGRAGSFDLAASEALRGEILEWVASWCGF